jgi:hypothetical protein
MELQITGQAVVQVAAVQLFPQEDLLVLLALELLTKDMPEV